VHHHDESVYLAIARRREHSLKVATIDRNCEGPFVEPVAVPGNYHATGHHHQANHDNNTHHYALRSSLNWHVRNIHDSLGA